MHRRLRVLQSAGGALCAGRKRIRGVDKQARRCRHGAAPVQVVVVWHPHLAGVPVVVDDAESVNATLVDMVTAAVGQAADVERHDGAEHRVL